MLGLFSGGGSLFLEGLIIGRNFAFQNELGLTIKTASTNSPWVDIREGLLSEGFVHLRFGGLFFLGGGGLLSEFYRIMLIVTKIILLRLKCLKDWLIRKSSGILLFVF